MADAVYADRMSDSDALTWTVERDPLLRSTIVGVWLLDRSPDPVRLRAKIEATGRAVPRLSQRVIEDPLGVAPPRWSDDASFDLAYHLRRVAAPGQGTLRDLFDVAEPMAMQAFDRDRPLWELSQVDGLEGGRSGIILKIHHAMSDGVGLVRMTAGLVERGREAGEEADVPPLAAEPVPEPWSPVDETLDALRYQASQRIEQGRSAAAAVAQGLSRLLRQPADTVRDARGLAASAARMLAPAAEPLSPIMRGRSLGLRLWGFSRPLEGFKRAGKAAGATVNDAFVAGVAGGLRRYHESHGESVAELRMSMPVNLRHGEKGRRAGNQFAPVRFPVSVGEADPRKRMQLIHQRILAERSEPSLPALDVIAGAMRRLPAAAATAAFGGMLKAVDFITSNVPGPTFPVYLAGARVLDMIPFGPLGGSACNITLFSYDGAVQIGMNADRAAVPDAESFARCLEAGIDEVLAVVV